MATSWAHRATADEGMSEQYALDGHPREVPLRRHSRESALLSGINSCRDTEDVATQGWTAVTRNLDSKKVVTPLSYPEPRTSIVIPAKAGIQRF